VYCYIPGYGLNLPRDHCPDWKARLPAGLESPWKGGLTEIGGRMSMEGRLLLVIGIVDGLMVGWGTRRNWWGSRLIWAWQAFVPMKASPCLSRVGCGIKRMHHVEAAHPHHHWPTEADPRSNGWIWEGPVGHCWQTRQRSAWCGPPEP
jgi:hypothetical protein